MTLLKTKDRHISSTHCIVLNIQRQNAHYSFFTQSVHYDTLKHRSIVTQSYSDIPYITAIAKVEPISESDPPKSPLIFQGIENVVVVWTTNKRPLQTQVSFRCKATIHPTLWVICNRVQLCKNSIKLFRWIIISDNLQNYIFMYDITVFPVDVDCSTYGNRKKDTYI